MAELWKELHLKALENKGENEARFLSQFSMKIPRYTTGCKCGEHWNIWMKQHPPKYGQNGEFFEWSVQAHNHVNALTGKKQYTVEEAKAFYQNQKV